MISSQENMDLIEKTWQADKKEWTQRTKETYKDRWGENKQTDTNTPRHS